MASPLNNGGSNGSVTPSTALLNQRRATSPGPRMLTEYEVQLLRKSAAEILERVRTLRLHPEP